MNNVISGGSRPTVKRQMFDAPFRIAHVRDDQAYWTKDGWGLKAHATVYAAEDRSRVTLPAEGCWELVAREGVGR